MSLVLICDKADGFFLPCDTVLAWYTLWPCVCLSVDHKSAFCQNG